ncbi:16717_t:CDS:2, partial [Acaulospora morrowiae]
MSVDYLQTKMHNFLINAEERHININATSVVHQGLEENPWIPQNELREIVNRIFEDAFEGVSTLYDLGKLKRDTGLLYQSLLSDLNAISITNLSWKDPLASQVISDESEFVKKLPEFKKKDLWKFVLDFNGYQIKMNLAKFIHDGIWKESNEDIRPFSSELAKTLNEGTYQSIVIVSVIRTTLKNLPIGDSFFISTSEKQSIASANRKGSTKKDDDKIKLWRETNDGLYWIRQSLKPDKDQFGIVGIQVAGSVLHLNLLVRDM